jgi:mRNA interferase RelE/StbE
MAYRILIADIALTTLKRIDSRTKATIKNKIEDLKTEPALRGKPLSGDLAAYRSIHAAGRYRIVYEVRQAEVVVYIVMVGLRKDGNREDVYETLKRYIQLGLIEQPKK